MYGFSWKHKLDVCRNNESLWPGFLWPALPLKRMMDLLSLLSVYCTQSYETWPLMSWIVRTCPNIHHLRNILMCSLCLAFFFFFFCFILSHFVSTVFEKSYRHFLHGCWAVSMAMGVSSLASEIYPWRRRRRGRRWWKVFWLQMNLVVFLWFHIFCVLLFSSMVLLKHTSIRGFVFVYWVHVPSTGLLI